MQIEISMSEAESLIRLIDSAIDRAGPGARLREAVALGPIAAKIIAAAEAEQKAGKPGG
jgi:hypothetical protein